MFRFDFNNQASLRAPDAKRLASLLMNKVYPWTHYYKRHKEAHLKYGREYYAKNKERILARRKARKAQ